jgi:hypothetical protein
MTGSDLILLAPWIAFGVGLAMLVLRLHLLRRRRRAAPDGTQGKGPSQYELHDGSGRR